MKKKNKTRLTPDFCVIGAGSGGLSFAAGATQMGTSVVLVERSKMGGDCLNTGCVPSKSLIAAAQIGHDIQTASKFGWRLEKPKVDFKKVHDHVQGVIANIAPHDSVERFEGLGVNVILEGGQFKDDKTLETKTHLIQAKRFVIATGSHPFIPPIEGLSQIPYYTNENIFDLQELPEHLIIIGGGPIGIELAQAFQRLGSQVTVLEAFKTLPKDDPEITAKLKDILIGEGIKIQENAKIISIQEKSKNIKCSYEDEKGKSHEILATHILIATGRRPTIENLNLEAAHIKFSPKGIEVDSHLRTSNSRVYAIGDCTGGYQFTHVANYHASLVIRNGIFKLNAKVRTTPIPWVTYTDPELAHVGFLESQLQDQKLPYKVLHLDFDDNDRAQAERRIEGVIKILVSPKGHILGATILGVSGGELIYPWVIAVQNNLKISAIANSIAPYPTLSDINKRIAGQFYADKLFSSRMKKIVNWLMWFTR